MKPTLPLVASLALLLSACATPPDTPFCRKLTGQVIEKRDEFGIPTRTLRPNPKCMEQIGEPECGSCKWTISDRRRFVGEDKKNHLYGKPWTQILAEAAIVPSEGVAEMKSYIIKNCKKHGDCNRNIDRWRVKLDAIDSIDDAVKPVSP